ncbi:MAG: dihydroxyacetone kinase phosphoryl donor subunit DhaM, partial [Nitriliruptoraceae bacterium]
MPVGIVVVSHSAALAAAAAELASAMAGDDLRLALAGGIDDEEAPLGTDAVKVMAAIEEVDDPAGVMVLMDLGSAVLSAEMALDLLPPETAERVVLCEAPIVEGLIAAAVQASAGAPIAEVVAEARAGLDAKASHLGVEPAHAAAAPTAPASAEDGDVPSASLRFTVPNGLGFHARPAARLVELLAKLDAEVRIT